MRKILLLYFHTLSNLIFTITYVTIIKNVKLLSNGRQYIEILRKLVNFPLTRNRYRGFPPSRSANAENQSDIFDSVTLRMNSYSDNFLISLIDK